jgi:hypothetical protein
MCCVFAELLRGVRLILLDARKGKRSHTPHTLCGTVAVKMK